MTESRSRVPHRLRWAVKSLPIQANERILEIGCGTGGALGLIAERLTSGQVIGVDRSAAAIRSAFRRNRANILAGRVRLIHSSLADVPRDVRCDVAFAVNVNLFWLDRRQELAVLRRLLKPGCRLWLFFEPPSMKQSARILDQSARALLERGFHVVRRLRADLGPRQGIGLVAERAKNG